MKAEMETFFAGAEPSAITKCEVRMNGDAIVVSFDDDDGAGRKVVWSGREVGSDRWLLTCTQPTGRAALSRSAMDPNALEGSWVEGGERGMWVIDLQADEDADD